MIISFSSALNFSKHDNDSKTLNAIMATGEIKYGDTNKLDKYLSKLPHKKHTAIYFDSPGGSLSEGIQLGRYFKENKIKTVVQGYKICASACALAFLGGTDYKGNKWMSTTTISLLGFHAFQSVNGKNVLDTDQTQQVVSEILKYAKYVNAPMDIIIKNFSTPSKNMYWLSTQEALSLGIKVWDIKNKNFLKEHDFNSKAGSGIYPNIDYACMTTHSYDKQTKKKIKLSPKEQGFYTLNVIDDNRLKIGYFIYSFIGTDAGKDIYRHYYDKPELKGAYIDFKIGLGVQKGEKIFRPMYFDYYNQQGGFELTDSGICTERAALFSK